MQLPLISVIVPVFNRVSLIGETLNSLLSQTCRNWECIIVDDGSTDGTVDLIKNYTRKDDRLRLYCRPGNIPKGASPCRNFGLLQAKGDYIQFLDSDDLLNERKFEEQLKSLRNSPPGSVATCKWGSFSVSSNLRVKTRYHSYRSFANSKNLLASFGKHDEYFPPLVYLVPKEIIQKAGPWDETIEQNPNDDGEYFTRVILNAYRIKFCEKAEVYYRAGQENRLSLLNQSQKVRGVLESWKMIQHHLRQNPRVSRLYVGNGIRSIIKRIGGSYPEIVYEYADFLEDYKLPKKWYQRLLGN